VALIIETSNDYARGLLHGVVTYMREQRNWSTYLPEHTRGEQPPAWLSGWKGDGIIARIENLNIAKAVLACGLPAVDVSAANLAPTLPWVETDDVAIARMGAEHLLERGFKQFAFCGDNRFNWSRWRAEQFQRSVTERGYPCNMFNSPAQAFGARPPAEEEWVKYIARLAVWLTALPKPVGIMACFDPVGRHLLEACRSATIAVPDDAAVIGVDNDELLCELADPPLSSVAPDTNRTGYEAAALLDRMMSGEAVEARAYRFEPSSVVVRASSDVLAIDDAEVSQTIRFIREHACEGITVDDILNHVPMSRRMLEARFKKLIGRTLHDDIDRVQLDRAKELLRETDLSLPEVARRAGYRHPEYLSVVFKKKTGITPGEFRRRNPRRS
jgi:LacI family transcriptional regulator